MSTSCGETSERRAAAFHAALAGLYVVAVAFHILSAVRHWERGA